MIGIRKKVLDGNKTAVDVAVAAAKKQGRKDARNARLGMIPMLLMVFVWGWVFGVRFTRKHDADVNIAGTNGIWYPLSTQGKQVPLRKIKCEGACSVNRTGDTMTILTFPDAECAPLPEEHDPMFKKMRWRDARP